MVTGALKKEMEEKMATHVAWKDLGESGLMSARNNLEKSAFLLRSRPRVCVANIDSWLIADM